MAEADKTNRSLYLLLGAIIVAVVVAVSELHGTYSYLTKKQQIIERMKQDSAMSAAALQNNIATFMESYAINEYSKLIATEVKLREHLAIVVEDYSMGMIVGETLTRFPP